jgi:adenylate cyclase
MSTQLASAYEQLQSLNQNLQARVDSQVQELERATRLKRYLSPQVAESILESSVDVSVDSRRRNLTVFFSDIRGFTELSERMEPEELVDMLNQYLSAMTEIVFKYGGTLDKYIGDAIMVFFGDPIPYDDHAERAVNMALEMRRKLTELQQQWFASRDEILTIGMGISTGYVTVGNIGSSARMEYTVVGNHVNAASRLAGQAVAGQILVTERTMVAVRDAVAGREIGQVEIKGFQRPLRIYDIEDAG